MDDLRTLVEEIDAAGVPPRWEAGRLRAAWDACRDVDTMIAVLRRGCTVGVFEIDGTQEWGRDGAVERWLFRLRSEGRYYRIDVRREDGADGVRRCFPAFPDDWGEPLDEALASMAPLERLRSDLTNGRPVTIDAQTHAAWASCTEPTTLLLLLPLLGRKDAAARLAGALPELPRGALVTPPQWKRAALAVIHAEFPHVPPDQKIADDIL